MFKTKTGIFCFKSIKSLHKYKDTLIKENCKPPIELHRIMSSLALSFTFLFLSQIKSSEQTDKIIYLRYR